jgi:SnoaL-like domain
MSANSLEKVQDILEIQSLKALYFEILDSFTSDANKAAARLNDVLAEDVKADHGAMGVTEGRQQVVSFLTEVCSKPAWLWHSLHSPRVEVTGDTAIGHWTTSGQAKMIASGPVLSATNRSISQFRRTPQGWRITSIRTVQEHMG